MRRAPRSRPVAEPAAVSSERYERLDALRGVAIVWMVAFHFSFDLNHFHFIRQNFYADPVWTVQRTCIVSLFLFCAGVGQSVAWHLGQGWPRFWRRWVRVAVCAGLVTLGSWWMFPRSFISFGVLHGLALMLLLMRLTAPWASRWLLLLGAVALALPHVFRHPFFDTMATNWVGLVTHKPVTEDYAPLLPWVGLMWWAMVAGRWTLERRPDWLTGPLPRAGRPLALLGRWPLSIYMLHQPLLIGLVSVAAWLRAG